MSELTPTVYLPIESRARELDARLLLTGKLLDHDLTVILGDQRLLFANLAFCPKGVVMLKGLNGIPAGYMAALKAHGYSCIACDEEALGVAGAEYMQRDIRPSVGDDCEMIFAQGPFHRDVILERTGCPVEKVLTLGNGRFDLLRSSIRSLYDAEAAEIHRIQGDFVLFNTNIGFVYSSWGSLDDHDKILEKIGWTHPSDPRSYELHVAAVTLDRLNLDVSRRTVRGFAERNPGVRVVVRPHPSERLDAWGDDFCDLANVAIVRDGSHVAMMLAARLTLHTGCTTGIEAMLLERPVLSVRAETEDQGQWRWFASNLINPLSIGADDAVRRVEAFLAGTLDLETDRPEERAAARQVHFSGTQGLLVSEGIADAILERIDVAGGFTSKFVWAPLQPARMQTSIDVAAYTRRKMKIGRDEITARYGELQACIGNDTPATINEIGESLFVFRKAS